jgi:hypothetical protein
LCAANGEDLEAGALAKPAGVGRGDAVQRLLSGGFSGCWDSSEAVTTLEEDSIVTGFQIKFSHKSKLLQE